MIEEKPIKYALRNDRYAKVRGGPSQFLDIYCSRCRHHLALYQKDGHGSLLRMYLDRIFAPRHLAVLQSTVLEKNDLCGLKCPQCQALIGIPMVYEQEARLALRLIQGSFIKKKSDGLYPATPSFQPHLFANK
jgi:hypothetical protein